MVTRILSVISFYILLSFSLFGQGNADPCHKSTEGIDFWFGFMESRNYSSDHYLKITVTARKTTNFTISIGINEVPFNGTFTVNADSSYQLEIPWELVEAAGSEEIQNKGIHLVAEKPVNVYAGNWDKNSADLTVIFPTESLGNEYYAMCYDVNPDDTDNGDYGGGGNSEFLIVATQDFTQVLIIPSTVTDKNRNAGDSISFTLNKGETYQVQSTNGDLTGSYISASKPVAFYSGALAATIPALLGVSGWDHLYEQIPPVKAWGHEFFAVPLKSRQQDLYRIMAADDNTTVQITGKQDTVLNKGEFAEIVLLYNEPSRIKADKPILVAQFSQSKSVDEGFTGGNGDPFMIILNSIAEWNTDVTFVAYSSSQIKVYYINIVALTDEIKNIRYDGKSISGEFKPFTEGGYSYVQKTINPGTHRIENVNKSKGFLAYVYGFGGLESYGYSVGFNLDLVLDLGESIDFDGDTLFLCYGDKITLDAGSYFDTYSWNTGDTSQKLTVDKTGKYLVQTTSINGCDFKDSIFVFVSHPKVDLGLDYDEVCFPYLIELKGNDDFEKYIWQNEFNDTLSTDPFFIADSEGEYRISVFDKYGCAARDTIKLLVLPVPEVQLSGSNYICGEKFTQIKALISGTAEDISNFEESYKWTANDPSVIFSESSIDSTNIRVTDWGNFEIYFQLQTVDNCITIDTFRVGFHQRPNSQFNIEDDAECEGYSKKLVFPGFGSASESATFYWDLDGSQFVDTLGWQTYKVSAGASLNKQPLIKLVIDDNGCFSDTTIKPLDAKPNFVMEADNIKGCDELTVNFSSYLLTDDKVDFYWTFHDDEIVNGQEVQKLYSDTGFFKVNLTIINPVTKCTNGFTVDSMIKVYPKPISKFEVDFPEALDENPTISYFNFSENAVDYFWDFGDGENSTEFEPIHTYREPGYYSNQLFVVSEFGCPDTSELTIKVIPFSVLSPNAFRPNSDIPENQTFMPVLIGVDESRFELKIYNRWGQIVFETNSPQNPWNGTDQKGNKSPMGNYVWVTHFYDILGSEHNPKGQILLIR